jgi:hypothetical protein
MPDPDLKSIENVWRKFVETMAHVLVMQPDDRPLDQYLAFRDEVLTLVTSNEFLTQLKAIWPVGETGGRAEKAVPDWEKIDTRIANLVLLEIESSARAAEVAKTAQGTDDERKERFNKILGRGSTVTGSVQDILKNILDKYPLLKGGLTVFRELLDIFKGK